MKKYINIAFGAIFFAVVLCGAAGCERSFDEPEDWVLRTDQDILNDGYEFVTINELKDYYYDVHGRGTLGKNVIIEDKVAIRGKVISTDRFGNIYKSLYLQDVDGGEYGAIEIKVGGTSMYNEYKIGQTIYVKADGLVLGDYRFNLSLGGPSSDERYANDNIDVRATILRHVIPGQLTSLTAADTLVVSNMNQLRDPEDTGRLVRVTDLRSTWGTVNADGFSSSDIFPSFLESVTENQVTTYTNYVFTTVIAEWQAYEADPDNVPMPESPRPGLDRIRVQRLPSWAFKNTTLSYYGSCLFVQNGNSGYVVRSSGYSRFALDPVPADGTMTDITAILTRYSSSGGGYKKYQLLLNSTRDVIIK